MSARASIPGFIHQNGVYVYVVCGVDRKVLTIVMVLAGGGLLKNDVTNW